MKTWGVSPKAVAGLAAFALAGLVSQSASSQTATTKPAPVVFDAAADANARVATAIRKAGVDNQRVLVLFGAAGDEPSLALHRVITKDRELSRTILYEYRLVPVDVGKTERNLEIAA